MITAILKQVLTDSGCTLVIYEQDKLANLYTDQSNQTDLVGVINQLNVMKLEVKANSIIEHYPDLRIEVIKQVGLEDAADSNEVKLQATLDICKGIILRLIGSQLFKKIETVSPEKILETKYDANVIGWVMPIDLYYLKNENKDPCL